MRWLGFALLSAAYLLGFFHRMAPAMVAPDLQAALAVNATRLGLLTASYFYIYTALQPAAGLAADWLGPRRAVGWLGLVGGAGSIVFGLADSFAMASVGRLLVGAGTAFLFVGLMKYNSLWFSAERYGRISGLTLLIGNLGALLAAAPLAWLLGFVDWRGVFVGLGVFGIALSLAVLLCVRLPPEHAPARPAARRVLAMPGIRWGALALFGTVGNIFAFAGLWTLPLLQDRFGLPREQAAAPATVLMGGLVLGVITAGWVSDRIGRRRPVALLGATLLVLGFAGLALLPWAPGWSATLLFALLGLGGGWVSVIYANAKELAGQGSAGFAIGIANTGLFAGAALMQSAFGAVLDWVDPQLAGGGYGDAAWQAALLFSTSS